MILGDLPDFNQFARQSAAAAADLALFLADRPDDQVEAELERVRVNLTDRLGAVLGARTAAQIGFLFVEAVRGRRIEIGGDRGRA